LASFFIPVKYIIILLIKVEGESCSCWQSLFQQHEARPHFHTLRCNFFPNISHFLNLYFYSQLAVILENVASGEVLEINGDAKRIFYNLLANNN